MPRRRRVVISIRTRNPPLSGHAREALDRCVGESGLIFGAHDVKRYMRAAAKTLGIEPHRAEWVSAYDTRHARPTHLLQAGAPVPGVMFLGGWTQLATMSRYLNLSAVDAAEAIRLGDLVPGKPAAKRTTRKVSGKPSPKPTPRGVSGKNSGEAPL
jgi:integrase